jgi:hypothetical protein
MKNTIHEIVWGKDNRSNGLIALCIVSLIVLGCTCNFGNPLQKENNTGPATNPSSQARKPETRPAIDSATPEPEMVKTPRLEASKTPEASPVANIPSPVEVAFVHFLDEARRELGGKLTVGSPKKTATKIEVRVVADGESETLVVMQKSNDGRKATVIVGPKDAGAVRSYTLTLQIDEWKITSVKELGG